MDTDQLPESENPIAPPPSRKSNWASSREIGNLLQTQWPRYLVDIIVIILGITISFSLDNYKDESERVATEQIYLKSLLADIDADLVELDSVIGRTRVVLKEADVLLSLSDQGPLKDQESFITSLKVVTRRPNFISKDATFSDLRSSGNMQLLTDVRLKGGLFEYYRLYESIKAVETSEREVANTILADYLFSHFSIKGMSDSHRGPIVRKGIELDDIVHDIGFSNVVSFRRISRLELLDSYMEARRLADRIKVKIEGLVRSSGNI